LLLRVEVVAAPGGQHDGAVAVTDQALCHGYPDLTAATENQNRSAHPQESARSRADPLPTLWQISPRGRAQNGLDQFCCRVYTLTNITGIGASEVDCAQETWLEGSYRRRCSRPDARRHPGVRIGDLGR